MGKLTGLEDGSNTTQRMQAAVKVQKKKKLVSHLNFALAVFFTLL